jgi:hypothetical protein
MYTATMAVAHSLSTSESACKKECIFFKDRLRRKEKDCERAWEREYGSGEHESNDEYLWSQVVTINDHVITNGITFVVDGSGININRNSFRAHAIVQETERIVLERYAQTFLTGADITPKFAFQIPLVSDINTCNTGNGNNNVNDALALVLNITGVWETESKFGLDYRWMQLNDSCNDATKLRATLPVGGVACEQYLRLYRHSNNRYTESDGYPCKDDG